MLPFIDRLAIGLLNSAELTFTPNKPLRPVGWEGPHLRFAVTGSRIGYDREIECTLTIDLMEGTAWLTAAAQDDGSGRGLPAHDVGHVYKMTFESMGNPRKAAQAETPVRIIEVSENGIGEEADFLDLTAEES